MVIIGVFYSMSFSRAFRNEILLNVDKDLESVCTQMDNELSIFGSTVGQISASTPLREMAARFDPSTVNSLRAVLANYTATNRFVNEIYLCFPKMEYIVSSSSSNTLSYFTRRYFTMDDVTPEQMEAVFTAKTPTILPAHMMHQFAFPSEQTVLFSYPVYTDYLEQVGTIVFQVPCSHIDALFNDKFATYNGQSMLLDDQLSLITGVDLPPALAEAAAQIPKTGLDAFLDRLGSTYIVRSTVSSANNFTYLMLVPRAQQAFSQITRLNYLFFLALLAMSLLSGVAIAGMLRLNYLPLRKLQVKAERLGSQNSSPNELSSIERALDTLSGRNLYLEQKLENNALSVKNARLQKLLADGYHSVQEFNMDCQELDMTFDSDRLLVTTTLIHTDPAACVEKVVRELKAAVPPGITIYYLQSLERNRLIVFHCLRQGAGLDDIVRLFTALHAHMLSAEHILLTTGIGTFAQGTACMSQSYLDSSTALDYRFVKGNGQVICFQEINTASANPYPRQEFERLRTALQAESAHRIGECIDDITRGIGENNYPLPMARAICFNLINMVTNTANDSAGYEPFVKLNIMALSEIDTVQDLVSLLRQWQSSRLAAGTDAPGSQKGCEADLAEVQDYLKANCLRCDFSLYETAEHFGMPLPKFSQFFKERTGQDALEYTIQLRMQKAACLLVSTADSINDIAQQTGYYNTSSFIRRFRQFHGLTPGEYRKAAHAGKLPRAH